MYKASTFPDGLGQNEKLPIRIVSPDFGHLSAESSINYKPTQSLPYYFFSLY